MGRDLRADLTTVPATDVVSICRGLVRQRGSALRTELLGDHAEWGHAEENAARLLEVALWQAGMEWADRIHDPDDDAEARRARLDAKRRGVKPPPRPIIPPSAERPKDIAEARFQAYIDEVTQHTGNAAADKSSSDREAFERAHNLD